MMREHILPPLFACINAQIAMYLVFVLKLIYLLSNIRLDDKPIPGFPIFGQQLEEWLNNKAKARFTQNSSQIVRDGVAQVWNAPNIEQR